MAVARKPTIDSKAMTPQSGPVGTPGQGLPPSVRHRNTLAKAAVWANKEMGLGQTYQDYVNGKISAGEYLQKHQYVRAVLWKAGKVNHANPHLNMDVVDHARLLHQQNLEKQQRAAEAEKKKATPKRKAKK